MPGRLWALLPIRENVRKQSHAVDGDRVSSQPNASLQTYSRIGKAGALHPASLAARREGDLVAVLLVNEKKTRPLIDVLCVRGNLRRRGLAEALAHRVALQLKEGGEPGTDSVLCSGYLLANRGSAAWHESAGFIELPDWLVMTHRYRCLRHNLQRGLVEDPFWAKHQTERLQADLNGMREKRRDDPMAYSPSRWLVPKEEGTGGDRIESCLEGYSEWIGGLEPV